MTSLLSNDSTVAVTTKTVHTEIGAGGNGDGASESDTGLLVGMAVISTLFVLTLVGIAGFYMYRRRRHEAKNINARYQNLGKPL